jgi:hypothetical protein
MFNLELIKESITFRNGKSMMASKVESLNLRVIELDGSGLDITLHELEFFPNFGSIFLVLTKP